MDEFCKSCPVLAHGHKKLCLDDIRICCRCDERKNWSRQPIKVVSKQQKKKAKPIIKMSPNRNF